MSWYDDEFNAFGGPVKAYNKYFPADVKDYLNSGVTYTTKYFNYIW